MMKTVAVKIIAVSLLVLAVATPRGRAAGADASLRQTTEVISVLKSNYVDRDKLNGGHFAAQAFDPVRPAQADHEFAAFVVGIEQVYNVN